jgi:DNA-binding NtrC family response regulator
MANDKTRVLAIDDDGQTLEILQRALSDQGYVVVAADSGESGLALYAEKRFDLVLLDIRMPEMDGFEVLSRIREHDAEATVIIMTGYGSIDSVVRAMKGGATDYLSKPLDLDHLEIVLQKALRSRRQSEELRLLKEQLVHQGSFEGLVGVSPPMQQVYELIRRLADSDTTVLIQGETGTGKELVARAMHNLNVRREKGFMAINCGALPESILESELFGHEKGAFTGAVKQKYGLIEQAEGGTLFLDEIEEMSSALQVKLLRAIQEREVLRVGGDRPIKVDFRLVAATNVDLRERMEEEAFRADLFYRLSVVTVDLPPLWERPGDIPLLAEHFARRLAERSDREVRGIAPEAMQVLQGYRWPGNVRELENAVEQAMVLSRGIRIEVGDLPKHLEAPVPGVEGDEFQRLPFRQAREAFERRYFEAALARANGVVAEAARTVGMPRQYFYEKMKRYGISRE